MRFHFPRPRALLRLVSKVAPGYRALHRIADALDHTLRRGFLRAVRELRGRVDLTRLRELLERGDQGELGAFWEAYEADVAPALRPAIREAFMQSAERAAKPFGVTFDLTNPRAVEAINRQAAELVRDITTESRDAIRAVLREGFEQGIPVPEMARRIRSSIGLTERYVRAVEHFREAQLEAGVKPGVVEERAERYSNRLLNLRARTIARTETIAASNTGQHEAWLEAQRQGLIAGGTRRRWLITPDDRLCPICEAIPDLNPDGVALQEAFKTDVGPVMNPPAHPACRCATGLSFPEEA